MATRTEVRVVNVAGLVQGIVLVTFPAASTIFTDPDEYDLSSTAYGALFIPRSAVMLVGLLVASAGLPREAAGAAPAPPGRSRAAIPARFWILAAFAVLYGLCETMNGNWSQLDMTTSVGASTTAAAGVSLPAIFAAAAVASAVMAALTFVIARPTHEIPALHPRPA